MHDDLTGLNFSAADPFEVDGMRNSARKTREALLHAEKSRQTGSVGFRKGTAILTVEGPCPIEELRVGQLVHTRDHGILPITWTGPTGRNGGGEKTFLFAQAGAVGHNEAICLAPRQAILISNWQDDPSPEHQEALVEIRGLDCLDGVARVRQAVEYCYHFMLPNHALIMANGLWCDSLHPDDATDQTVGTSAMESIAAHLQTVPSYGPKLLSVITGVEAREIIRG